MIELQRQILLPPQNAGPSGPVAAMGLPVPIVAPVRPLSAQDDRQGTALAGGRRQQIVPPGEDGMQAADRRSQGRRIGPGLHGEAGGAGGQGAIGRLAFLAQQIFQEAMPTGLHLEPWAQGIGAYRRAGAEPPLPSVGPAVVSLAI